VPTRCDDATMNPFDAFVSAVTVLAIAMGFHAGLLRSLATILGYLVAAPLAITFTPYVMAFALGRSGAAPDNAWLVLVVVFVALGALIAALLRTVVGEFAGPDIGLFDRIAGAALGAVRIFLIAVLVVVIFDRVIPAARDPQFLTGSRLRPYLSAAGRAGLQSLPPEVEDYIDRLKRERGM
jgi:membrane protein required for colicin V production